MYDIFSKLLELNNVRASDVSRATGINQTVFSEWKKGKSSPKIDKMQKIAEYFGVTVEYLMTGEENEQKKSPSALENFERRVMMLRENTDYPAIKDEKDYEVMSNLLLGLIKLCPEYAKLRLADFIRLQRIEENLTEKTVAERSGISLKQYLQIEDGVFSDVNLVIKIMIILNLDIYQVAAHLEGAVCAYVTTIELYAPENERERLMKYTKSRFYDHPTRIKRKVD